MKAFLLGATLAAAATPPLSAQTRIKQLVYGEIGAGAGQTLFFGDLDNKLKQGIRSRDFEPGVAGNILLGFYVAPARWKGLGVGGRLKWSGAMSPAKDTQGGDYFFNYYNLGASAKYYPISREFDKGLYVRTTVGIGQLTTKHQYNDPQDTYVHQFAIGSVVTGSLGWTLPLKTMSVSLEGEFEAGRRNGTISGAGRQLFRSGQLGTNLVVSF